MKKMNNKGFSLIELIIVIAIMAVLVAVIAPNLTGYIGKSKENTDTSNADTIANTIGNALQDFTTDTEMKWEHDDAAGSTAGQLADTALKTTKDFSTGQPLDDFMALAFAEKGQTSFLGSVYKQLEKYADKSTGKINTKVQKNKYWIKITGSYDEGYVCEVKSSQNNPWTAQATTQAPSN